MSRKLLFATLLSSVMLAGCSSGGGEDLTSLKAEVAALKQEVEALKQQLADSPASAGSSDQSGSDASPAASEASYNLGQPFQYDGVEFTITERERTTQIHEQIVAAEGYEFLLYNITLHNAGSEDYSYSQNDYSIVLSNGEIQDNHLILDLKNVLDDFLGTGELAPGGQTTGWVAFEVPVGDQPIEFRYVKATFSGIKGSFKIRL